VAVLPFLIGAAFLTIYAVVQVILTPGGSSLQIAVRNGVEPASIGVWLRTSAVGIIGG
jgi:hypothetical protein